MTTSASARRSIALTGLCLGFLMITLDTTIVNVALGATTRDLGGSLGGAQWIVDGYTLAFAALLLTAGALGDRLGSRRGYLVGLGIFSIGSVGCAAAPTLPVLVTARVVQGAGAAWLMPTSLAVITHLFTGPTERRRALAIWGGVSGVGLAGGPVLGGVLVEVLGWRAIFFVNLPVAAVAALLVVRAVDETGRHRHPLDPIGQILGAAALALLTGGFILAGDHGWAGTTTVGCLAAGTAVGAAFVIGQLRAAAPMVDPEMFRRPPFAIAVAIGLLFNFCLYGAIFCLSISLGAQHDLDALHTGLALLPVTAVTGTCAFLSGTLVSRIGEWRTMRIGLVCGAIGAGLVAINRPDGSIVVLMLSSVPLGLTALAMPAMTALAMSAAPADRIGLASGIFNAARQTGGAFGVAVLGAFLGDGLPDAFAGIAAVYVVAAALTVRGAPRDTPVADVPSASTPTRA